MASMGLNIEEQKAVDRFRQEVVEPSQTKLVILDFWAEWCGPCKAIAPIMDEIADEQAGSVKVAKVNIDEAQSIAIKYEVMSIPTMILFKDGEPVKKMVGAKPKDSIMSEISAFL